MVTWSRKGDLFRARQIAFGGQAQLTLAALPRGLLGWQPLAKLLAILLKKFSETNPTRHHTHIVKAAITSFGVMQGPGAVLQAGLGQHFVIWG